MDANNPAVASQTAISPADLERVAKDPTLLTETARKMLAVQMVTMHKRAADPNMPIGQRQSWMEFLAKIGDAVPKQNAVLAGGPGAGFSVQIIMNQPAAQPAPVIEATTAEVIEGATPSSADTPDSADE